MISTPPPSSLAHADLSSLAAATRRRRRRPVWPLVPLTVLLVVGSGAVWQGTAGTVVDEVPLPEQTYAVAADEAVLAAQEQLAGFEQPAVEETGPEEAEPSPEPDATAMTLAAMPYSSVWIPSLEAHAPISGSAEFVASSYDHVTTLSIPKSAKEVGWYSAGGALAGRGEGTTLLASHASTRKDPGVFREIYTMQPGDLVWTRDEEGRLQGWAVRHLWASDHDQFPEEYFAADGERQLVLTTCGGRLNSRGVYAQNVFAVATPVEVGTRA